jgi:hypothetical protein
VREPSHGRDIGLAGLTRARWGSLDLPSVAWRKSAPGALDAEHTEQLVSFLRFMRYKRAQRLKGIEQSFEDLVDSR